ncbi:MAG: DUF4912 domain-containing protein [Pirellulales bacterium]
MRKAQLVRALLRVSQKRAAKRNGVGTPRTVSPRTGSKPPRRTGAAKSAAVKAAAARMKSAAHAKRSQIVQKRVAEFRAQWERARDLAAKTSQIHPGGCPKDRLVVMVRDPYWLHAYWELTRASVERARAALGQDWHAARPVLRLLEVSSRGTALVERVIRDIEIHGGVNNWYIDVHNPPCTYRIEIGYRNADGKRFYSLGRSNIVTTPPAGTCGVLDDNWAGVAEDFDKIFSMSGGYNAQGDSSELRELFEERLRRPMGSPMVTRFGGGVRSLLPKEDQFEFDVDAEMIVYGITKPDAYVTLKGEPIRLREDGTFTVRLKMPESREVIPVVASTVDGVEQRTVVLSIDRNTKVMEPVIRDVGGP